MQTPDASRESSPKAAPLTVHRPMGHDPPTDRKEVDMEKVFALETIFMRLSGWRPS